MQSLPSEIKHLIAELSSPSSLAALAQTHTTYQRAAEEALYDTIFISALSDNSLKCMEILATMPEKAGLVRYLTIEYARNNNVKNRSLTTYLSKSLANMHSLSDFRIRSGLGKVIAQMIKGLGKILWSVCKIVIFFKTYDPICWRYSEGHFRLQTFYCHDYINISQVIKSQPELQILGLYSPRNILKTLNELRDAQLFLPIILTLERDIFTPDSDHISIFPTFYSVDRRATIHQVLAQSFCKDQGNYYLVARSNNVRELSIYLIDYSDLPSISALVNVMAVSFPRIDWLNLWFERRCDIVSFFVDDFITALESKRYKFSAGRGD